MTSAMMRMSALGLALVVALTPTSVMALHSEDSPTCRKAYGESKEDLDRALTFCADTITDNISGFIEGVIAQQTILTVKVDRRLADGLVRDRLSTESIVKAWMRAWKKLTDSKAVTVYVEWGDVQIAKGETTLFSGDVVKIK